MAPGPSRPVQQLERPTVVLVGEVGVGKSFLVEKLTGLSSDQAMSWTTAMRAFTCFDSRLEVIDTPGTNASTDRFRSMLHIAYAMSHKPVTRVLLVVEAERRLDRTLETLQHSLDVFLGASLDLGLFAVCVTKMDQKMDQVSDEDTWRAAFEMEVAELGLHPQSVLFSSWTTPGALLCHGLLHLCNGRGPTQIQMDAKTFLQCFKIHDANLRVLRSVKEEVAKFKKQKDLFLEKLADLTLEEGEEHRFAAEPQLRPRHRSAASYNLSDKKQDLVFSFHAYMMEEIPKAQRRVAEQYKMLFQAGPQLASEAGHLANLANACREGLFQIRMMMMPYQKDGGVSDVRQCPHCGCLWFKFDGDDGETTCGNRVTVGEGKEEIRTFTFHFDDDKLELEIRPGRRTFTWAEESDFEGSGVGCGRAIVWRDMRPVAFPREFQEVGKVNTYDVMPLPRPEFETFKAFYYYELVELARGLKLRAP